MRLTTFSLSPKIRSFLIGAIVFCITFALSFIVFGGVTKLKRMNEAERVAAINKKYYLEKNLERKKQEALAKSVLESSSKELSSPVAEDVNLQKITTVTPSSDGKTIASQVKTAAITSIESSEKAPAAASAITTTQVSRAKTIEAMVAKFSNVLDLGANAEWKSYPQDLRKEAFAIMNAKKSQTSTVVPVQKQNTSTKNSSNIDKIFQADTSQETQKWGEYIVLSGDTWEKIAAKYGLPVEDLKLMNPDIKRLFSGNKIIVPYKK